MDKEIVTTARCEFEGILAKNEMDVTELTSNDLSTLHDWIDWSVSEPEQIARFAVILAGKLEEVSEGVYQIAPPTIPKILERLEEAEEMVQTGKNIYYLLI